MNLFPEKPLFQFTVPHVGVAKGRHRTRVARAKSGKAFAQSYTPEKTRSFEGLVREFAAQAMGAGMPHAIPLMLAVEFHFAIPPSWPKWKREMAEAGLVRHTKKPDCSNLVKAIEDAGNGVLFKDDGQVCQLHVTKHYTAGMERVEVTGWATSGIGSADGRERVTIARATLQP